MKKLINYHGHFYLGFALILVLQKGYICFFLQPHYDCTTSMSFSSNGTFKAEGEVVGSRHIGCVRNYQLKKKNAFNKNNMPSNMSQWALAQKHIPPYKSKVKGKVLGSRLTLRVNFKFGEIRANRIKEEVLKESSCLSPVCVITNTKMFSILSQ